MKYGVEYYSDTRGNGVKWFSSQDERDIWLFGLSDNNQFYLITKNKS